MTGDRRGTVLSRRLWWVTRVLAGFVLPLAAYYGLRSLGVSVFGAVLVSTLLSAVPSAVTLLRERRLDAMSVYLTVMLVGAVLVSLVSGSTRVLLAKGALLTGVTGVWFIVSLWGRRPLAYTFSRPLAEGRLQWPADWDDLWDRSPRFRRMWRVSSVVWGIGGLLDAAARVVLAWTLPPDDVPVLATGLVWVTGGVLFVGTNLWYARCGVFHRGSAMYAEAGRGRYAGDPPGWSADSDRTRDREPAGRAQT